MDQFEKKGRPAVRWTDDLISAAGILWKRNVHGKGLGRLMPRDGRRDT